MMNEKKQELFKTVLTKPYDHQAYVRFLQEFFNKMQLVAPGKFNKEYSSLSLVIEGYYHIGNYTGEDGKKIALFAIQLNNKHNVENARSAQRSFIKSLLDSSNYDGAMASFYTMDKGASGELVPSDKWRLSFIRMEYGFAEGKISQKLTPAKRYSYLVGQGEPCHTAQERLYPLFEQDDVMPALDDLENAFSVEAVTKQFYNSYRDKYLQVKEYLEGNTEFVNEAKYHGFTSEQFTKKLMGQIVFLYFIQKKGWLGVDAFPPHMTEKQYKDAFFRNSQSRSLIGRVYSAPDAEGWAHLNMQELFRMNDEDAKFVASLVPGKAWGEGTKDFMRVLFDSCEKQGKNYFDDYLEPLFYEALNVNRGEKGYYPRFHRRVPFLNGGLFEQLENYDWQHNDFDIPNELFSNRKTKGKDEADGILDVFDRYNFTMAEDEPMEREVAIDPEMLGKVFENLLDVKDRKSKGAFYTPREIVHYMCQESLINYLASNTGIADEDIRKFILYGEYFCDSDTLKTKRVVKNGKRTYEIDKNRPLEIPVSIFSFTENVNRIKELDDLLANVKIADPAVGSGAFLLGLLNEIVKARQTLTAYMGIEMNSFERLNLYVYGRKAYDLKVLTIKNCLFACDLEPSATDITKLRLWLSIVIDDETVEQANSNGLFDEHTQPRQLPNLDCNIICGNSLMDEFGGIKLITESNLLNNQAKTGMDSFYQTGFDTMLEELIRLQDEMYFTKDHETKHEIKQQIQEIYDRCILHQLEANPAAVEAYQGVKMQPSKPFILWQLSFPKVFMEKRGFDIVIGNPPYIGFHNVPHKDYNKENYFTADGKYDFYVLFIEKGIELLHDNGMLSFICPSYFYQRKYGKNTRKLLLDTGKIKFIADFSDAQIFEAALTYTCIFGFVKNANMNEEIKILDESLNSDNAHFINQLSLTEPGWKLADDAIVTKLAAKADNIFSDITVSIPEGIVTGSNSVYLIDECLITANSLEMDYLHKAYKGRDIKDGDLINSHQYLFYPYQQNDKGKTKVIDEKTLQDKCPNIYQYLIQFKDELLKRKWFKKSSKKWFELWNPRKIEHFLNEKFVFSELGLVNDFVLVNECFYTDSACGAEIKGSFKQYTNYLSLYLNSNLATYVYKQISVPKANGYSIYKKAFLEEFDVILPEVDELPKFDNMSQEVFNRYICDYIGLDEFEKNKIDNYIRFLKKGR